MEPSVAIVEDDRPLRALLTRGLREEGFQVLSPMGSGGELLERVTAAAPDVIIMDIGLPDADGRDVVLALRARDIWTPVLILTARGGLTDRLSGFHSGADDYLPKPFSFAELIVRLRSLIRRPTAGNSPRSESDKLWLDPARHAACLNGESVTLTPTEFRLLAALEAGRGSVVRRAALIAAAWPDGAIVYDNTLDAYVTRLRRKLRGLGLTEAIHTVRGVGYRVS